jgi:hypothetical protein
MNKIFKKRFLAFFFTLLIAFIISIKPVFAIDNDEFDIDCRITVGGVETSTSTNNAPNLPNDGQTGTIFGGASKYSFEIIVCPGDFSLLSDDLTTYRGNGERVAAHMSTTGFNFTFGGGRASSILTPNAAGCLTGTFESAASSVSDFTIDIESEDSDTPICRREHGHLSPLQRDEDNDVGYDGAVNDLCNSLSFSPENPTIEDQIEISAVIPLWFFSDNSLVVTPDGRTYRLAYRFSDASGDEIDKDEGISVNQGGMANTRFRRTYTNLATAAYTFDFFLTTANSYDDVDLCSTVFSVGTINSPGQQLTGDVLEYSICQSNLAHNDTSLTSCIACSDKKGIWTAIGCIDQDPKSMIGRLITIGTGIVGGVFLLRVLAAAFMLTTSQGDVKKTSEAKEMITEAIVGVIVIIFSVTLIQFFGSDILKIPGFGS